MSEALTEGGMEREDGRRINFSIIRSEPSEPYHHLSMACPPTTATAATTATTVTTAMGFPLDKPRHSFAPFPAHSRTDQLDPPLVVHHTHSPSSASSFASSTLSSMATNTDSGEPDTSPSSAPSLFNDTSPSLPQTPSSANSHFRLDLHSTDFSAAAAAAAAALKQRQLHLAATDDHILTSGRGVFPLFLAQRSPVLKACTLIKRIGHS
jgi:hypothetical protein